MDFIMALIAACSVNASSSSASIVMSNQRECQAKLAECLEDNRTATNNKLLNCLKDISNK